MTDKIRRLHATADALLARIVARSLEDIAAAAYPSAGDGPHVSSSGMANPTEAAGIAGRLGRAGDHQLVERVLGQVVDQLDRLEARMTPQATGEQCPTAARDEATGKIVRCERQVTHHGTGRGLCERCDGWYGKPQTRGLNPTVAWIKDGNDQVKHPCGCHDDACAHDHAPGGCMNWLDPGCRTGQCATCRKRRSRAKDAGGAHPWQWHDQPA